MCKRKMQAVPYGHPLLYQEKKSVPRKQHHSQLTLTTRRGIPLRETTEAELQSAVIDLLRKAGYLVIRHNSGGTYDRRGRYVQFYHIHGADKPGSGLPDILALRGGHCLMLEIKRRTGKPSDVQEQFREYAAQHGVTVAVVRSVEDVMPLIRPP